MGSKKRIFLNFLVFCVLIFWGTQLLWADEALTPSPTFLPTPVKVTRPKMRLTPTPTESLEYEKQQLEIERLKLENERLKLELEKMSLQATQTVVVEKKDTKEQEKEEMESSLRQQSEKATSLAKENKDKENLLILDFVHGEAWHRGTQYSVHGIYDMAEDEKLKMKKYLDKRDMNGDERNYYIIQNLSLLRYRQRPRGIFSLKAPARDTDFHILTVEGVSFDSTMSDVRNAYGNGFFKYDGESNQDKLKFLKYKYSGDFFTWPDKLEFGFDKDGKLMEIRYGVLDEN